MAVISDSQTKIQSLLSYKWNDWSITDDDVKNVAKEFEGMQPDQVQTVVGNLSDELFMRWAENMVGSFGSAMDGQKKYDVFYKFASCGDGKLLARIAKIFLKFEDTHVYRTLPQPASTYDGKSYSPIAYAEMYPALLSQAGVRTEVIDDFIAEMREYYDAHPYSETKPQFNRLIAANAEVPKNGSQTKAVGEAQRKIQDATRYSDGWHFDETVMREFNGLQANDRNTLVSHLDDATLAKIGEQLNMAPDWTTQSTFSKSLSQGLDAKQMSRLASDMALWVYGSDDACANLYLNYFGEIKSDLSKLAEFKRNMDAFYMTYPKASGRAEFEALYK